jgi:hypothetical protein
MWQVLKFSFVALALSTMIGLGSKPALARHANDCVTQWAYWWKHGHCHVTYPPHWSHRWRDYDQRW